MATLTPAVVYQCSHCPLKTPSEENIGNHILKRECPNGSFSYKKVNS